ncbi:MAG: signal peptidase I [Candidatus Obscuribacterales bacterium]|nr:signal peptidase I [Candidatus Obscuribacterales bacterium]
MTLKKVLIIGIIVLVVALVAARAAICPINIGNEAISPTLKKGDVILVNRAAKLMQQPLKHFDVIAISPPYVDGNPYTPPDSLESAIADYTGLPVGAPTMIDVRRVIALPGETIVVRKDLGVFIDGKLLDESSYLTHQLQSDLFVLDDITKQSLDQGNAQPYQNSEAPIVVPQDSIFVLPDNRMDFVGSDMWGFIPQGRIIGKVEFKIGNGNIAELKTPTLQFATEKVAMNDDGVRALGKGEFARAIQLFKSALAIDNSFELARDNLSIAYNNFAIQSIKTPDLALDSLHKALFLDPDNQLTKKNLAGVIDRLGKSATKYEDRIALADEALKRGKVISALVEYREAVKLNPNPTILAKVSSLEAKCNFPAHAIPEDQVQSKTISATQPRSAEPGQKDVKAVKSAHKQSTKSQSDEEAASKSKVANKPPDGPKNAIALSKKVNTTDEALKSSSQPTSKTGEEAHKLSASEPNATAKEIEKESKEEKDLKRSIAKKPSAVKATEQKDSKEVIAEKPADTKKGSSSKSDASNPISMTGALANLKAGLTGDSGAKIEKEEKQKSSYDHHNLGRDNADKAVAVAPKKGENASKKVNSKKASSNHPIEDTQREDSSAPEKIASITKESKNTPDSTASKRKGTAKSKAESSDSGDQAAVKQKTSDEVNELSKPTEKIGQELSTKPEKPNSESASEKSQHKQVTGKPEATDKVPHKQESAKVESEDKTENHKVADKGATEEKTAKSKKHEKNSADGKKLSSSSLGPTQGEEVSEATGNSQSGEETKSTPLKPVILKKRTEGFNLGTMMQSMFSGMTGKTDEASTGSYRGPPLLRKSNDSER